MLLFLFVITIFRCVDINPPLGRWMCFEFLFRSKDKFTNDLSVVFHVTNVYQILRKNLGQY